jgi:hypothetical protein
MVPSSDLPADVLEFIESRIDSVPHMEALLLLWESAPDQENPAEASPSIYIVRGLAFLLLIAAIVYKNRR